MKKLILFALCMIFLVGGVIAPGPNLHLDVLDTSLAEMNDTLIAGIINENYDACLAGLSYADVGIFEYWTNFKSYKELHGYNTVDEMLRIARNDRDRAFTYCYKIHLAGDGISHNFYIPAAIKRTKLPNYITHPPQELMVEGHYLDPRANRLMERSEEFDWLVEKATGRDWSPEARRLNTILGGGQFYDKAYAPDTSTFMGKFQKVLYTGVGKFVSEEKSVDLRELMIEETKAVFRGETSSLDPSGEEALRSADESTQLWLYGGSIVLIIVLFYLSFRWSLIGWNKNKFKFR